MKCPKCKVEAVVIDAKVYTKNGNVIAEKKVQCPNCLQLGEITEVIGPEHEEATDGKTVE